MPARIDSETAERVIQEKLRWILQASEPAAVIVYGSAARGEMTEASDIDLILVYRDAEALKIGRKAIFSQPPPDTWPVDMLFMTSESFNKKRESGGLYELVMKEGRFIHGGIQ